MRKRRGLVVGIVVVLGASVLLLMLGSKPGPGRLPGSSLEVRLTAAATRVTPLGKVAVTAEVLASGAPVVDRTMQYRWLASGGHTLGRGSRVTWMAPHAAGAFTVSVEVRLADGHALTATTSIVVEVLAEPPPFADGVPISTPGYGIDEVTLEKSHICVDEDVLVKVRAHDPVGDDAWLEPRVSFGGFNGSGWEVAARVGATYVDFPRYFPDRNQLKVYLFDNRQARIVAEKTVAIEVDETCHAPHGGLHVECVVEDDWHPVCEAVPPEGFHAVRYEWDIGVDPEGARPLAASQHTPGNRVRIDAPQAVQARIFNTFMVRARAFAADGSWVEGRATVLTPNTSWEIAARTGKLPLRILHDGHPSRDGQTLVTHARVMNPFAEPVELEDLEIVTRACGTDAQVLRETTAAQSLTGVRQLAPGQMIELDWRFPADAGRCWASARLRGHGVESGLIAEGAIEMPSDPSMIKPLAGGDLERALLAMKILSQRRGVPVSQATEAELEELEREGAIPPRQTP